MNVREAENKWWRHQWETFFVLLAICAGNSPVTAEFPAQMPVTRNFDVFFVLLLNKRLSKQWWGWWFERPSLPLWRHCNEKVLYVEITFPWNNLSRKVLLKLFLIGILVQRLFYYIAINISNFHLHFFMNQCDRKKKMVLHHGFNECVLSYPYSCWMCCDEQK